MSELFPAARALTVKSTAIPVLAGQPALVPLKLEGSEGINSLFDYKLTLQTPDALNFMGGEGSNFDLASFIGLELTCGIELEGHGHFVPGMPGGSGSSNQGAGVREISRMNWDLNTELGPEEAKAFRHQHLHLSLNLDATGMGPRYKSNNTLERHHEPG